MKPFATLCLLLSLVFVPLVMAYESPVGVINSPDGGSFNNSTTASTFTVSSNDFYAIQCEAAVCVHAGSGSSTTATCSKGSASTGVKVAADTLYDIPTATTGGTAVDTIAIIPVSGDAGCQVYRVITP